MRPSEYYLMDEGEKTVIQAFYKIEMEEQKEKIEAVAKAGGCPSMAFS